MVAFWNSLHYGLAQDAYLWLARARGLFPHTTGVWRTLSYDVYYRVMDAGFGLDGRPYHAVGLALHALNAALVAALALRFGLSSAAAFLAASFFAVHYASFDALFAVGSISEPLAAAFVLFSLWLALPPEGRARRRLRDAGVTLSFVAALLSKETVVLYPALLWLVTRLRPNAARGAVIPCAVAAVAYLAYFWSTDPVGSLRAAPGANPYESHWDASLLASWATYQAWAVHLTNLYQADLHDRVASHLEGWVVTAAGVLTLALLIARAQRARRIEAPLSAAAIGAAVYAAFIAPVLPLATHAFHLYLYLPLVGLGWMLAAAWDAWVPGKARWIAWLVAAGFAVQGVVNLRGIEVIPLRETRLPFMGSVRRALTAERLLKGLANPGAPLPDTLTMIGPDALSPPTRPDTTELGAFLFNDVAGAVNEGNGIRLWFPRVRHVDFFGDLGPWLRQPDVAVFDYEGNVMRVPAAWLYLRRAQVEWEAGRIPLAADAMAGAEEMTARWQAMGGGPWRAQGLTAIRQQAQTMIEAEARARADDPRARARPGYLGAVSRVAELAR